jgi:hypothetical protein
MLDPLLQLSELLAAVQNAFTGDDKAREDQIKKVKGPPLRVITYYRLLGLTTRCISIYLVSLTTIPR